MVMVERYRYGGWDTGTEAGIQVRRLVVVMVERYRYGGWDTGTEAGIQVQRLGYRYAGWWW